MWCAVKVVEDFPGGNSRKSHIKHLKSKRNIDLGIYNSRLKPKILTEMITKHYLIIVH